MKKVIKENDIAIYWLENINPFFLICPWQGVHFISPIFIIPEFQNKGIASTVIEQLFDIYPDTIEWRLDTIKQETGNCHLYEKFGFVRVGEDIVVNEKMTLVDYVKSCIRVRRFEENDNRRIW